MGVRGVPISVRGIGKGNVGQLFLLMFSGVRK